MKKIHTILFSLIAASLLAQIGIGGSNGGVSKFPGPQAYKDKESGTIFYVESDGRHLAAIDSNAKLLWTREPFVDAKLKPYRTYQPQIVFVGALDPNALDDWAKRKGSRKVLSIRFNSTQFGVLDITNGDFTFLGND